MKVVITGASGFLGNTLFVFLKSKGFDVKGYTRRDFKDLIQIKNYKYLPFTDNTILIHLAQSRNLDSGYSNEQIELCKLLSSYNWSHIIYASSAAVYGDKNKSKNYPNELIKPINDYTRLKIDSENVFLNKNATCLRFANIYGPGMSKKSVIYEILEQIPNKGPIRIKDNSVIRDFIWIQDCVNCIKAACEVKSNGIFNVGTGESISIGNLVNLVLKIINHKSRKVISESNNKSFSKLCLDISNTTETFSWTIETSLKAGLSKIIKRKNYNA